MARTITDIKNEITTAFVGDSTIQNAYGIVPGTSFSTAFSKVSIESILFYIIATAIWTLEILFDKHKTEVEQLIASKKPHSLLWYRDKAFDFQYGRELVADTDTYQVINDDEKIVKYASAVEYDGKLYIKVAKGETEKLPLSEEEHLAISYYYQEIKDAGVILEVINLPADAFKLEMDVYYDPMVLNDEGLRLDSGADAVRDAIKDFLSNKIPFNGEYRNLDLVNALEQVEGVVIPELKVSQTREYSSNDWIVIRAKYTPKSGYYKIYDDGDLVLNFYPYRAEV